MYNFDLYANGLLNTKFSEVCSFSLQLAHDESFNFLIDAFLLFPVACKLSFEAFLERLSLKTSLFRKHSMLQYFVHELTQANLKQGIRRYRKNKSVVPFHVSIKVFKFTQLCINSRTDKL